LKFDVLGTIISDFPFIFQPIGALAVILLSLILIRKYADCKMTFAKIRGFLLIACLFIAGTNLGNWFVYPFKSDISSLFYDLSDSSNQLYAIDQQSIAEWVEINTPENSIVGSNFLCSNLILTIKDISERLDCRNRNNFAWITALAHRQVLLEVWFPTELNVNVDTNINKYLYLSDTFATQNYSMSYEELVRLGVDYFVIDRSRTKLTTWSPNASIVFENESYLILML
jgi:hypothetical protein